MSQSLLYESYKSTVYYQEKGSPEGPVVIKMLKDKVPDQQEVIRFNNEFEVTRNLESTAIRRVYNKDKFNNFHALTLEYFEGETLGVCFLQNKHGLADFLKAAIKIAEGLGEVHNCNIVHKDITKNNILINLKNGNVKIIDFGIASKVDLKVQHVGNPKKLEGTLEYISPEQTGRLNRVVDYRTDLYSLGITFYELLTGRLPFLSENPLELVHHHIAKNPEPPANFQLFFDLEKRQVPKLLSEIILKLISKNAEDRYQSSYGLKCDLELALEQFERTGTVPEFELGKNDHSQKFQPASKLYGREKELKLLTDAFEKMMLPKSSSEAEVVMITGLSGVGKSALADEIHRLVNQKKGNFIAGKFDQFFQSVPFYAISKAFAAFVDPLLTEDEEVLKTWRNKILTELEGQGKVMTDVIPNLHLLIGEQPEVPELGGAEALNRMTYVFQKFVKIIAQKDHPLVLFIDDLQWADLASIDLLKDLSLNKEITDFLFIGAYRDNEVNNAHPLILSFEEIKKGGVIIHDVKLENLLFKDIRQLVADTLRCTTDETNDLAGLLLEKTKGNAFFINQFLRSLYEDKSLVFDFAKRKWAWDIDKISKRQMTDNVIDLLTEKINVLDAATQKILKLASCNGNVFDVSILSAASKLSEEQVVKDLWPAVKEGLIVPHGKGNYYSIDTLLYSEGKSKKQFRFVHDKIQQAIYFPIPENEKGAFHVETGRALSHGISETEKAERVFDIVNQYNIGNELIWDSKEKFELAQLNNTAGKKAKNSGAYKTSLELLANGISLLPADSWTTNYDLTVSLYSEITETAFLMGRYEMMETCGAKVLANTKNVLDRVRIYDCKIQAYISQNKFPETIATGLDILEQLGVTFPKNTKGIHIGLALVRTKIALSGKKIEEHINLPAMTDPYKIQAMGILQRMIPAAFMSGSLLFPLIVFKLVNISLKYGNSPISAFGYACYAISCVGVLGEFNNGYRFGNLSLKLAERLNDDEAKAKVGFVYNCFVKHWKEPLKETIAPLLETYKLGFKVGAVVDGVWAACYQFIWSYYSGTSLEILKQKLSDFEEVFRQRDAGAHQMSNLLRQAVENLSNEEIEKPYKISGKYYDENTMLSVHKNASDKSSVCIYFLNKIQLCYLFCEYEEAQKNLDDFKSFSEAVTGLAFVPIFNFYESLVALGLIKKGHPNSQKLLKVVDKNQSKMKKWSGHAPMNYQHKYFLVEGERNVIAGNKNEARVFFDKAISLAGKNGFVHEEAIAFELASNYYNKEENIFLAEVYMQRAVEVYLSWGAKSKRKQLLNLFPELLAGISMQDTGNKNENSRSVKTTSSRNVSDLDLATLMKASTSISGEIILEKLLSTLMGTVIENAGAQKGVLLLEKNGKLFIEAQGSLDETNITVLQSIAISNENIPLSIINYVNRTHEFVVLDNATASGNFTNDAYIISQQPKSILCGPIIDKGKTIGIIYLENNITVKAFTADRLEILKLLSGQIAVSIDNALLYENLEQKVAERTTEIREQKEVIEHQNGELVSSIRYAQRIQKAVLPNEEILKNVFPDSFVLFLPKDIVSGDFYWFAQRGDKFIVTAVDCTGHGVPGAFMSMIGSALLNEIVIENNVTEPEEILNHLHNGIVKSLGQTGNEGGSRDGMDLALVVWDKTKNEISFSGANNPLYFVGKEEIKIIRANKRPIGYYASDPEPFTKTIIPVEKGDCFYIFSDGYADQFGGERNKKYGYRKLQADLDQNKNASMEDQKEILAKNFEAWKNGVEQIDDVCMIGVRV